MVPGQPVMVPITSIQQFQRAQLGLPGGGATQFSIAAGNPYLALGQVDVGAYVGDDWRVRPNVTLSLGLRYETQTNIRDARDFAPRFGFAWAPGANRSACIRSSCCAADSACSTRASISPISRPPNATTAVQQEYIVDNPPFSRPFRPSHNCWPCPAFSPRRPFRN